jgi:hypothetical protein
VLSNKKILVDILRRLYIAIVVNVAIWWSESCWALKEENRKKLETFHHTRCLRRMCKWTMLDIAEKWITNEQARRAAGNSLTSNGIDDGSAKMPMALQTQRNGKAKISKANIWRGMVSNTTTSRETAADHTPRL